ASPTSGNRIWLANRLTGTSALPVGASTALASIRSSTSSSTASVSSASSTSTRLLIFRPFISCTRSTLPLGFGSVSEVGTTALPFSGLNQSRGASTSLGFAATFGSTTLTSACSSTLGCIAAPIKEGRTSRASANSPDTLMVIFASASALLSANNAVIASLTVSNKDRSHSTQHRAGPKQGDHWRQPPGRNRPSQ